MTEEVFDFLHFLQSARRQGRRTKVKKVTAVRGGRLMTLPELSFEAWLEIKANRWASFSTKGFTEIRGTRRSAYARCMDGYVYLTRKGVHAVWDWLENDAALAILDRMGTASSKQQL
jgi:hypothetical protein